MTLKGVHLSKYCYTNSRQSSCPALRSFALNMGDLLPYNINKTTNNNLYYTKILMTSNSDNKDASCV
jgi:hypothetical protein